MSIDPEIARQLGFPRPQYTSIERERRWLCREVPQLQIRRTEVITDLYVTGARLRLRAARPTDGGQPMLRLTRKADVDIHTRLITSIYLPEDEFAILATSLQGSKIMKLRHRLAPIDGVSLIIDEFQGDLEGLILAEAEFNSAQELAAYPGPSFSIREVSDDPRFTGAQLVRHGIPAEPDKTPSNQIGGRWPSYSEFDVGHEQSFANDSSRATGFRAVDLGGALAAHPCGD